MDLDEPDLHIKKPAAISNAGLVPQSYWHSIGIQFVYIVGAVNVILLVIMLLTGRMVKAGVEVVSVVEYAFHLNSRILCIRQVYFSDVGAIQFVDRRHVIFVLAFETAYVINVVAYTFYPLAEKICPFAFELHISDRFQVSIKYDDVVVFSEPAYIAIVLLVIRNSCKSLVTSDH